MKKNIALAVLVGLTSCSDGIMQPYDKAQKPAEINIKGYSKPEVIQLRLNGEPITINGNNTYTNHIEARVRFVMDEGESDKLSIYSNETGKEIARYNINYNNLEEYKNLNFFNLPGIFLQTYVIKPQVNLGKVGFQFIFPNLGEYSGSSLKDVKGILKRENGVMLAEFDHIGKRDFTVVKVYNFFSATAPVYLELYKPGTTEPYIGSQLIKIQIKQDIGANMIVLQERVENGATVVKGNINIADYL